MILPGQERRPPTHADISVIEDRWEAVCRGGFQRGDVFALVDSLSDRMRQRPEIKKCLVDVREAEITLGIMGEYVIGEYAAKKLAGLRVALIQGAGQIKKLMEDTAYNRGLRILMVENRQAALAWLEK
ncbi:MAG TPA: hypothetical protein VJ385_07995 [Fibrobacteria bacterium]|nr:hypothetical protein [Fibrobacteria bacterium]